MKNVTTPLAKINSSSVRTNATIQKKSFGSGTTALIIQEMDDIMEIVKSLEESGLIGIGKQLKMKQKHKWMDFLVCCYEH